MIGNTYVHTVLLAMQSLRDTEKEEDRKGIRLQECIHLRILWRNEVSASKIRWIAWSHDSSKIKRKMT